MLGAMILGNGLGQVDWRAFDYEGRRWVPLFEGEYVKAKEIMNRLDIERVPNRLALPRDLPRYAVVVEVMKRWLPQAQELLADE
jgi:hypothetical protein